MGQLHISPSGAAYLDNLPAFDILSGRAAERNLQLKESNSGLAESIAYLALENLPSAVLIIDQKGRFEYANAECKKLFGQAALAGRPARELLTEEDTDTQSANTKIAKLKKADGQVLPVEISQNIIYLAGKAKTVSTLRVISQQQHYSQLHHDFIAQVVHELRTPLASISGVLCMLEEGILAKLTGKGRTLVSQLKMTCKRMSKLIDDLLDLEKLQAGKFSLELKPVYLPALLSRVVEGIMPIAESRRVSFESGQLSCFADEDRLIQVLINLLANAIKNSPDGSSIKILAEETANGVQISVIDHGRGIPQDKLEKVFELFEQVDLLDAKLRGGSGLGLAVCKAIVNEHGGEIGVESQLGQGSRFWFSIPLQR